MGRDSRETEVEGVRTPKPKEAADDGHTGAGGVEGVV